MSNDIISALRKADSNNDKRFEAIDKVIQSVSDEILDELSVSTAEIKSELRASLKRLKDNEPEEKEDDDSDDRRFEDIYARIVSLEDKIEKLLTAKRIPEYDTFGNVVAVRLEQ